jgi:hypothetical protein
MRLATKGRRRPRSGYNDRRTYAILVDIVNTLLETGRKSEVIQWPSRSQLNSRRA